MKKFAAPGRVVARRVAFSLGAAIASVLAPQAPAHSAFEPLFWPTNAGRCLTSSFGEWREGHFHSGVDVSTGGKVAFPVYAVADADVARLRISCRGYGRAIYLRLTDGRTAVYAHLEGFEGALADTVRAIQKRQASATFDQEIAPGSMHVRRGEMIGRTGQSGAGPPHLHFELRDASERALDPLAHGLGAEDTTPPRLLRVAVTPLTPESSVDGDSRTAIVRLTRGKNGAFIAEREVKAKGRVGIALEAKDGIDVCDRGMAPKRWELAEEGTTLFAVECDRFSFDEWGLVDLQFDPRSTYTSEGDFTNLWRRPGNEFPSSAGEWPASEGIVVDTERRTLEVAAVDAAGLRTAAEFVLIPDDEDRFTARDSVARPEDDFVVETRGSWLEVRSANPASLEGVRLADPTSKTRIFLKRAKAGARLIVVPGDARATVLRWGPDHSSTDSTAARAPTLTLPGLTCRANEAGRWTSPDSSVTVQFPNGVIREHLVAQFPVSDPPRRAKDLRPVGQLRRVETGFVPLAGEVEITMRAPASFAGDVDRLALYVQVGGAFRYMGGGNGRGTFTGKTQRPRPFGLFEDAVPPTIGPAKLVRRAGGWRAECTVKDGGAGIDCDDIEVTLEGRALLHEYDSETGDMIAHLDAPPPEGAARALRVAASDRVGNRSERTNEVTARTP